MFRKPRAHRVSLSVIVLLATASPTAPTVAAPSGDGTPTADACAKLGFSQASDRERDRRMVGGRTMAYAGSPPPPPSPYPQQAPKSAAVNEMVVSASRAPPG